MTTIVLNGVTLNPNMEWVDRFSPDEVAQEVQRTLGAKPVVFAGQLIKGQVITLEATEDHGWLLKSVADQVLDMAKVVGAVYTLQFNGVSYSVVFRHHEAPAVEFKALIPRVAHEATDYVIGTIKLMTV